MKNLISSIALSIVFSTTFGQKFENGSIVSSFDPSENEWLAHSMSGAINQKSTAFSAQNQLVAKGASLNKSMFTLHPDTSTRAVLDGISIPSTMESVGHLFDPKSPLWMDFSANKLYAISADAGFEIDSFIFSAYYFRPQATALSDTLNIQFFLQPNMQYWADSSLTNNRAFCLPEFDSIERKGKNEDLNLKMLLDNSSIQGLADRVIPVGLKVQAGYEVAVAFNFVPGNPYSAGDTVGVIVNPNGPGPGNVNSVWLTGVRDLDKNFYSGYYNYHFGTIGGNHYDPLGLKANDNIGHLSTLFYVTHDDFTAIAEEKERHLTVFPNPFANTLSIDLPNANFHGSLTVYDALGNVYDRKTIESSNQQLTIETTTYTKGVYFYSIQDLSGQVWRGKVIKN